MGRSERRWVIVACSLWAAALAMAIVVAVAVHRRAPAIIDTIVTPDPAPARQAVLHRLEADRLVREALLRHEAATSGTAKAPLTTGPLVLDAIPLLEQAERLYLESLDEATSQPPLLFQLGEVNLLMGRRARGYLYLARYWETKGQDGLARAYRHLAVQLDPATTIPLEADRRH